MRELVTVQAGGEANWVGAYFWALQEEEQRSDEAGEEEDTGGSTASSAAASTVLYEQASAVSSRAFGVEPRVLLFDEPEAFNPFQAAAAEAEGKEGSSRAAALTWQGGVDVHMLQGQGQQHMTQETAASPRTWNEAWHGLRSWPQLGRHCVGHTPDAGGWSEAQGGDQLRRLLEGCDAPQGAHVLVELCGPWLGYGLGAAEEWGEEVGGGGLVCLALHHAASVRSTSTAAKEQESWRLVEAALGVHRLLETGALLLPLGVMGHGQHHHHDEREQRRARQAVGLAAASAIYARGGEEAGRCHMREWVHGVRSGCSSGVASVELGFPFPPLQHSPAAAPPVSLHQLLQPSDPRTALSPTSPPSGLLSHLVALTPGHPSPSSTPLRRVSGLVSLIGGGGGGGANDGLWALNDAAKFYPWFQPELNYAEPNPFPVRRWPFPVAWRATPAEQGDEEKEGKGTHGYGTLSMVGCTSATLPFLHELSRGLRARGPGVRARLREERGLLAEDVAEVEEALDGLCAAFEGEGGAEEG